MYWLFIVFLGIEEGVFSLLQKVAKCRAQELLPLWCDAAFELPMVASPLGEAGRELKKVKEMKRPKEMYTLTDARKYFQDTLETPKGASAGFVCVFAPVATPKTW